MFKNSLNINDFSFIFTKVWQRQSPNLNSGNFCFYLGGTVFGNVSCFLVGIPRGAALLLFKFDTHQF